MWRHLRGLAAFSLHETGSDCLQLGRFQTPKHGISSQTLNLLKRTSRSHKAQAQHCGWRDILSVAEGGIMVHPGKLWPEGPSPVHPFTLIAIISKSGAFLCQEPYGPRWLPPLRVGAPSGNPVYEHAQSSAARHRLSSQLRASTPP